MDAEITASSKSQRQNWVHLLLTPQIGRRGLRTWSRVLFLLPFWPQCVMSTCTCGRDQGVYEGQEIKKGGGLGVTSIRWEGSGYYQHISFQHAFKMYFLINFENMHVQCKMQNTSAVHSNAMHKANILNSSVYTSQTFFSCSETFSLHLFFFSLQHSCH